MSASSSVPSLRNLDYISTRCRSCSTWNEFKGSKPGGKRPKPPATIESSRLKRVLLPPRLTGGRPSLKFASESPTRYLMLAEPGVTELLPLLNNLAGVNGFGVMVLS